MKIITVAERYYPIVGGVETQTRLVVQEMARQGHNVEVVATNFEERSLPQRLRVLGGSLLAPTYKDFTDEGTPVHALTPSLWDRLQMAPIAVRAIPFLRSRAHHSLRRFGHRWYRAVYISKLKRLFRGADVVHSVAGGYLGCAAQEAARAEGLPFVCTPYVHPGQHGADSDSVDFYRASDAVLALLETDKRLLMDLGVPEDIIHLYGVVPLLPDEAHPGAFRSEHDIGDRPIVLFVGRMEKYKGVDAIRAAAPRVWGEIPDVQFVFIGPGSDDVKASFASDDPRLHYLGFVSKQEKADALAACDLFCMPSEHEILPAVYLEAWSYGKPVVGGVAHGLPELVEGNHAGLTVEQDPDELAATLIDLFQNPAKRREMGQNGQNLVQRRYSKEALVNRLESVYEQVIQHATPTEPPARVSS